MDNVIVQRTVIGVALGFILGFGSAWIWLDRSTPEIAGEEENIEENLVDESPVFSWGNASDRLEVVDQDAGALVYIKKALFDSVGWVVVYEEDETGEPGNILGARLFDSSLGESGTVELLRGTESGKEYFVILHKDNGDRQFDYRKDDVIRQDESNLLIVDTFKVN